VFSILRTKSVALKGSLRPVLELESGSNDPMAYLLTIAFMGLIMQPDKSIWSILPLFALQMSLGVALGFGSDSPASGSSIGLTNIRGALPSLSDHLDVSYFFRHQCFGGNGFLAIYLSAIYLGNKELIHKKTIIKMFDGLAWLMQIILFLTLGYWRFQVRFCPFWELVCSSLYSRF
jgi:cell volume regulation protein A